MIEVKTTTEMVEYEQVIDIKCNRCGLSISIAPPKDELFKGCEVEARFGYGSGRDLEIHRFHLCDCCADTFFGSFVWPADVSEEL